MGPVHLSLTAERVVATTFHSVAVLSTVFRLYRRYKQKNLWWDDTWVLVAVLLDLVYCSTIVLMLELSPDSLPPPQVRYRKIVAFWIAGILPHCVIWFSRVSICLSIAKIDMQISISRIRNIFYFLIAAFGLLMVAMLVQKIWICARDTSWYNIPPIRCYIGNARALMILIGDVLADTALTVLSLNLTWKVRMRPSQRRLLFVISLANILSSMVGIFYGVTDILADRLGPHRGLFVLMVLHIKTAVTLTVCNFLVVVTYVYAIFHRSSGSDNDGNTDTTPARERRPDDGEIKSTLEPPQTVYVLTQFDSNGSPLPPSQQGRATAYSWGGSELYRVPRPQFAVPTDTKESEEPSSLSSNSRYGVHTQELSKVIPEPCPQQPPEIYAPTSGSTVRRQVSQPDL